MTFVSLAELDDPTIVDRAVEVPQNGLRVPHVLDPRLEQRARRRDNSMELFGILMFDAWYRRYISAERPEALAEAFAS